MDRGGARAVVIPIVILTKVSIHEQGGRLSGESVFLDPGSSPG